MAVAAGAHGQHLRGRRHRRRPDPARRRASLDRVQAAVLRRDARRRRRHRSASSRSPNSPPDGYNFALTNISHLVLRPISKPKLGYDPMKDLTNIAYRRRARRSCSRSIPKSGVKTLKEFVERGKKTEQPLTYSSSGLGSWAIWSARSFRQGRRHQDRARALQGRLAGHHRSGRRPHRLVVADRVVDRVARCAAARLPRSRIPTSERLPGLPGHPDLQGAGLRPGGHHLVRHLRAGATCRKDITEKMNREIIRARVEAGGAGAHAPRRPGRRVR